jgi:RimJ/RimL family protein N-acetyltransferase
MIAPMPHLMTFADKPTLTGDRVMLRPVTAADADGLAVLVADPEVGRLTGSHPPAGPPSLADLRRWYASRADHDDRLDLAVVERATGRYAGEVVLSKLHPINRSCSFRIALAGAQVIGQGLGSEATRLILGHAFDTVGVHRVELEVFAFNPRARHVYEKAGFTHEGVRRNALWWDGEWVDAHLMAILAPDWDAAQR